jgi:hypothetical protein
MIHNTAYKMYTVFCTVIILYTLLTLYVYKLFHILLSFWQVINTWYAGIYLWSGLLRFSNQNLLAYARLLKSEYYKPEFRCECWNVICLQSHGQHRCPWPGIHPELKSSTQTDTIDAAAELALVSDRCTSQSAIPSHTTSVLSSLMNVRSFKKVPNRWRLIRSYVPTEIRLITSKHAAYN